MKSWSSVSFAKDILLLKFGREKDHKGKVHCSSLVDPVMYLARGETLEKSEKSSSSESSESSDVDALEAAINKAAAQKKQEIQKQNTKSAIKSIPATGYMGPVNSYLSQEEVNATGGDDSSSESSEDVDESSSDGEHVVAAGNYLSQADLRPESLISGQMNYLQNTDIEAALDDEEVAPANPNYLMPNETKNNDADESEVDPSSEESLKRPAVNMNYLQNAEITLIQNVNYLGQEVKGAGGYGNSDDDGVSESDIVGNGNGNNTTTATNDKSPRSPRSPKESIYGSNAQNPSVVPAAAGNGLGSNKSGTYMTKFNAGQNPTKDPNEANNQSAVQLLIDEEEFSASHSEEETSDAEEYEADDPAKNPYYWNQQFQKIRAMEDSLDKYRKLSNLAHDFVYAAQTYGRIIISERYLSNEQKTIKPKSLGGIAGGEKYIVQGILFKFAVDTNLREKVKLNFDYWMYGGKHQSDRNAAKAAGHELRGLVSYYNADVADLNFPLMALIDYRGYRLTAISIVPLDAKSLKYGSADAGKTIHADIPELNAKMERVGEVLNLKKHKVGEVYVAGPSDIEGHKGTDGKYYVLDFARTFPPEAPLKPLKRGDRRIYYYMLRPELVRRFKKPLNSDAFTSFYTFNKEIDDKEVEDATRFLLSEVLPEFAMKLSRMPVLMYRDSTIGIIEEMHREGINIRHLGRVRSMLPTAGLRKVLLIEMIARVAKNSLRRILRQKMRQVKIPSEDPYLKIILKYLNTLLGQEKKSDMFWKKTIKKEIQAKFPRALGVFKAAAGSVTIRELDPDFNLKHDWSNEDFVTLFNRIQEMTGIELTKKSFAELKLHPYSIKLLDTDIAQINSTVKHLNIVEEAEAKMMAFQFAIATGAQADRLWEILNKKFILAVASNTNSANTIFLWAQVLLAQGMKSNDTKAEENLKNARDKYNACSGLQPDNNEIYFQWGICLIELGKRKQSYEDQLMLFNEAVEKFEKAITLDEKNLDKLIIHSLETYKRIRRIMDAKEKPIVPTEVEQLFMSCFQMFKVVLLHRRDEKIFYQIGNLLVDWAKTKPSVNADEFYIRAAIMYESALKYAPAVTDGQFTYVIKELSKSTASDDDYPIQKINVAKVEIKDILKQFPEFPNEYSNVPVTKEQKLKEIEKEKRKAEKKKGTTPPPARKNTIELNPHSPRGRVESAAQGADNGNGSLSPRTISLSSGKVAVRQGSVANPLTDKAVIVSYGKDTKSAKTKEILPVENGTLTKSGSLLVAEEEIVEVYTNPESDLDNSNKRKSQRKFLSKLLQRYQLPKRKMDSQLWFNLMSVDSTNESLDVCRNILLNDQTRFQLTAPGNANLLCSYEGSRFSLTRVSIRFSKNTETGLPYNHKGRVLIFVLDNLPNNIREFDFFNDKTEKSWNTMRTGLAQKKKLHKIAEGNEPIAWFDTDAKEYMTEEGLPTLKMEKILLAPKTGKYILIKLIQVLDEKATGIQDPFSVEFLCFKGNQEYSEQQQLLAESKTSIVPPADSKELMTRSNTNTNLIAGSGVTRNPIRLFENVFELQGQKLAGLLRTVRCSPLLNSLFTVFIHHRMKHVVNKPRGFVSIFDESKSATYSLLTSVYQPPKTTGYVSIPALPLAPEFEEDTEYQSKDGLPLQSVHVHNSPNSVNGFTIKKLCQVFPNVIGTLDFSGTLTSLEGSMLYIIKYCPNLRHLILSNCPNISENSVGQAIQNLPSLRSLILTGNTHISDRLFNWIAKHGYNLERLALWPNVGDDKIKKLKACGNLRELQMNNNKTVTDKTFSKLLKKLNLLVLNVNGCSKALGDLSLQALAQFHRNLQALSALECGEFEPESIKQVLKSCLSLQAIQLDSQRAFNVVFRELAEHYSPVRVVRLRDTGVASGGDGIDDSATKEFCLAQRALAQSRVTGKLDEFLTQAAAVPKRKRTSTVGRSGFKKDRVNRGTVDWSSYQKEMEEIAKSAPTSEGTFTEQIKKKADRKKSFTEGDGDGIEGRESSANMLSIQLPKARSTIEILDLFRAAAKLTDTGLEDLAISCAFSLRILDLSYASSVTDKGVKALANCKLLEELRLEGNEQITHQSLDVVVEGCKQLNRVNFSGCMVSDRTVQILASKRNIRLVSLVLSGCKEITDLSLMALGNFCPNLLILSIRENPFVTDAAVLELAKKCPQLQFVDVNKCKNISVVPDLMKILPGCLFEY